MTGGWSRNLPSNLIRHILDHLKSAEARLSSDWHDEIYAAIQESKNE